MYRIFRRTVATGAVVALALGLSACASTPTHFYTLDALAPASAQRSTLAIVVAPVGVPPRVDRRQLVMGSGEVRIEPLAQWAAPLRDELGRTLALNLSHLLGAAQVAAWPQNLVSEPDCTVYLDIARFDSLPGKGIVLEASWVLRGSKGEQLGNGRKTYTEEPADGSIAALVSAHNRAQAALAGDIASAVQASPLPIR